MTDDMLGPRLPVRCISSIRHMYTTDFAYDGPICLVPLSPSYPSSPAYNVNWLFDKGEEVIEMYQSI